MTENNTKKQHFVPQMYLRRFTYDIDKNMCYTLNKSEEIHNVKISKICKKHYLYELRDNNGEIVYKNRYEKHFANIEDIFSQAIGDLIDDFEQEMPPLPPKMARSILTSFVAFLILKNPKIMNCDYLLQLPKTNLSKWEANNERIFQIFNYWWDLGKYFDEKFNIIFHKNNTTLPFVTANFPTASYPFGNQNVVFYFPMTPQLLVIFEPRTVMGFLPDRIINSNEDFVNFVNNVFHNCWSTELLISNNKDSLRILNKKELVNTNHNNL